MTKPKILVLGHLPPSAGGITSLLLTLLNSPITNDYDLVPFNIGRPAKRNVIHNYSYKVLMNAGVKRALLAVRITLWHMLSFPFAVLRHRPAMIHIHSAPFLVFWETTYYVLVARMLRIPCALQFHSWFRYFYERSSPLLRAVILWVVRKATVFVVICKEDVKLITERTPDSSRCIYLPNFIDVRIWRQSVSQMREHLEKGPEVVLLFLGGSDAAHKGVIELLRALCMLKESRPRLRVLLVAVPRELIERELPVDLLPQCEIKEWVSGDAKTKLFAQADIFILPSYAEGMPMGILEAMASSLPVIATKVGGIPDMITDGREGYLVEPGDCKGLAQAISELAQDSNKREQMGKRGWEKAQSLYDILAGVRQLHTLYEEVMLPPAHSLRIDSKPSTATLYGRRE